MARKDKQAQNQGLSDEYKKILSAVNRVYDSPEYQDRRKKMDRYLKEYKGEWWNTEFLDETDSKVFVNMFFADVETNAPLLTDNKPRWSVRARRPMWQGYMDMLQLAGDYLWDKLDMDMVCYDTLKNCLIMPVAIQKIFYDTEDNDIAVENIDPRTFYIAPGYSDPWKAPWCGEKRPTDMLWVKSAYPDEYMYVKADAQEKEIDFTLYNDLELSHQKVYVYEIWLKDDAVDEYITDEQHDLELGDGTVTTITEKVKHQKKKYPHGRIITLTRDHLLDDRPAPFAHGKAPYIPYYDYKNPDSFWGQGELDQLEDLVRELNFRIQDLVKGAHSAGDRNYTVDSGSGLDPEQIKGEFFKGSNFWSVNPGTVDPIRVVDPGAPNRVHYDLVNLMINMFQRISGTTDTSQGIVSKKQRQSAREIATLIESSYTRTRQRVRNYEWSLKRLFRLILELMMQYYVEPRHVNFSESTPDGISRSWAMVGNGPEMVMEAIRPIKLPGESDADYADRQSQDQDYQEFISWLQENKNVDRVYAAFDISIETNSSLPTDQQSRANLVMQLAQAQITPNSPVDRKAVLDTLRFPNAEEIDSRMSQKEQQMAAARQGAGQ